MATIWYERQSLNFFDEEIHYKGYVLVNELYEDDDVRKNFYMWGRVDGGCIVDAVALEGLSSKSYAPWKEVWEKFVETVDQLLTSS